MKPIDAYFKIEDIKCDVANMIIRYITEQRGSINDNKVSKFADEIVHHILVELRKEE